VTGRRLLRWSTGNWGSAVLRLAPGRTASGPAERSLVMGDRLHRVARGDLPFEVVNAYGAGRDETRSWYHGRGAFEKPGPNGDPLPIDSGRPLPNRSAPTVLDASLAAGCPAAVGRAS